MHEKHNNNFAPNYVKKITFHSYWLCSSAQLTGTMMPGAKIAPKGSLEPGGTAPATIPT
jgi:hypothetical protein